MKKIKSILIAVFLSLMCLFTIACDKDITGIYKTKSVTFDGDTVSVGELTPDSRDVLSENFCILELKKDNTVQMVATNSSGETASHEGVWAKEGKTIILTFITEGNTYKINCVQNRNEITIDFSGGLIIVVEKTI